MVYEKSIKVMIALSLCCACAKKQDSQPSGEPAAPAPEPAPDTSKVESTVADVTITNTLVLETGAGAGTELEMPPNSVGAGTKIEMRVATSAPAAFGSAGDTASAAIFMNAFDANGAEVKPLLPMTVALVVGGAAALTGVDKIDDNLCAALENSAGQRFVWRRGALEIAGGKARFKTKELGVFQLLYCGTKALDGFAEVGATGDTKAAAATVLEGTWKSGCIVDQNSRLRFTAQGDGTKLTVSLAGLTVLEAKTYAIPQDFPQVEFLATSAAGLDPVTFAATSGTFTVDSLDATGISGTFDALTGFTNGFSGDDITINFAMIPRDGTAGGTMAFQTGGTLSPHSFGTQQLMNPKLAFDGRSVTRDLQFAGGDLKFAEHVFGDADCKKETSYDLTQYAFTIGDAATVDTKPVTLLDLKVKSIQRTAVDPAEVASANANSGCGQTGWVAKVPKDVTGSAACKKRAAGTVVRQFFGINGSTLKLGEEKSDGSLPSNYDDEYEYLK